MKHFMFLLILVPLLFLGADGPTLPTPANPGAILQWDAPTLNADGSPCTDLGGYVVAISDATVDLLTGGTPLAQVQVPDPQLTQQAIAPLVSGRTTGLYRLWARAFDVSGNLSVWSAPFLVTLDPVGPQAPGRLRMKITVIVEVQ